MKIINASYKTINSKSPLKHIEKIGRVCYKSEDKITEDGESAKKFVSMLIKNNHGAMLEHANFAFIVPSHIFIDMGIRNSLLLETNIEHESGEIKSSKNNVLEFVETPYLRFTKLVSTTGESIRCIVSGNLRAWMNWFNLLGAVYPAEIASIIKESTDGIVDVFASKYEPVFPSADIKLITDFSELSLNERLIHETASVMFTTDRGISHELVRHRPASFAQESTRYVKYNNENKEGSDLTFINIEPGLEIEAKPDIPIDKIVGEWYSAMRDAESHYNAMIELGASPQMARSVLPTSTKTNITITANLKEWHHILSLRAADSTGSAHPQMKEVMLGVLSEFKDLYPEIFKDL